jgi:hypothetical protein
MNKKFDKHSDKARHDQSGDRVLVVSRAVLRRTHDYFQPYWAAGVETACFWFGHDAGYIQVVTTVAAPKLYQTRGNYQVERNSWRRLITSMRGQNLTTLTQVHTHPIDYGVRHSPYDDDIGYSTKEGALSLVWADYGYEMKFDLSSVGVHERLKDDWVLLDGNRVGARIRIVDDFADFRWEIESGSIYDEE